MPRRYNDEDDRDPPRRDKSGGMSTTTIVLIVLGLFAALAVAACGGLIFLGKRAVDQVQADMKQMEADLKAEQEAARADDPDRLPPPADGGPVPSPVPQPPATQYDAVGDGARWVVLFRGTDPTNWNSTVREVGEFAVPLRAAPATTKFLRLRRLDTGATLIIPLARKDLSEVVAVPGGVWNGTGATDDDFAHRLGIGHGAGGKVIVAELDGVARGGSGFGGLDGDTRATWAGKTLPETALEFSVTAGELTEKEKQQLLK